MFIELTKRAYTRDAKGRFSGTGGGNRPASSAGEHKQVVGQLSRASGVSFQHVAAGAHNKAYSTATNLSPASRKAFMDALHTAGFKKTPKPMWEGRDSYTHPTLNATVTIAHAKSGWITVF